MSGRDSSVLGFIEEVEGLLLAAGLGEQDPELMTLLPPCERAWANSGEWKGGLEVLWGKAQRLRMMFGADEAIDDRRACLNDWCDGCKNASEEQLEALERVSWNNNFAAYNKWRNRYPYGVWTCADGRQVLFNRHYKPILQRSPEGYVQWADPKEWVDWVRQAWFYGDGDTPYDGGCQETRDRLKAVIKVFYDGGDVEKEFAVKTGGAKIGLVK